MSSLLDPYIPLLEYLGVWFVIVGIGMLVKADKYGVNVKPYYLMLRTSVFNSWMQKLGGKFRRAWLTYFDIGAAMGLGLLAFIIFSLVLNALNLFHRSAQAGPTLLIIPVPGVTISWEIFPYILISIAVLLIPHEAAHGIASVLDKVPIKSSGVFLAIFLPGGFVEIDEEDLSKRKARTKLRVFAGGSFTNVVSWFLVVLLITNFALVISPLYDSKSSGLVAVNGTTVNSVESLRNVLSPLSAGHHLLLTINDAASNTQTTYSIVTQPASDNRSRATIGIFTFPFYKPVASFLPVSLPYHFYNTLSWMSLILLGVALVNMLPMFPFDGDRYFDTILGILGMKNTKNVRTIASIVSLLLLGSNLILSFVLFGTIFPK